MRIPRIFSPQPLHTDQLVELEANAARHLTRVLRLRVGDEVTLFNGEGGENGARIDRIERERVWMRLGVHRAREVESPLSIILGQGISRGERMDYTLQKAVELGVGEIYPLATERSVVRLAGERVDKKITHWQGVVNSACEQSGRNRVPKVHAPLALPQWLTTISMHTQRLTLSPTGTQRLRDCPVDNRLSVVLLIGPEGGLSAQELELSQSAQFIAVSLGPRILRTETAGVAALAALQMRWGDL